MMGQTVEQRRRHLRVAEHAWPFPEGEVGRDHDRGSLVEAADQMEQELAAGLGKRQIAQFVQNDEVEAGQIIGKAPLASATRFALQAVDEIDDIEEAAPGAATNAASGNGNREMRFAGAGRSSVTMPGVRRLRRAFSIRFILGVGRWCRSYTASGLPEKTIWSSSSPMGRLH